MPALKALINAEFPVISLDESETVPPMLLPTLLVLKLPKTLLARDAVCPLTTPPKLLSLGDKVIEVALSYTLLAVVLSDSSAGVIFAVVVAVVEDNV